MRKLALLGIFTLIAGIIVMGAAAMGVMLLVSEADKRIPEPSGAIESEMIRRAGATAGKNNANCIAFITPFLWEKGFYIDDTVGEEELRTLTGQKAEFQELTSGEQRFVFLYKGKITADVTIAKSEIDFHLTPGEIEPDAVWKTD